MWTSRRDWSRPEELKMSEAEIAEGVIIGGWSYVVAAYTITAAGLVSYIWSLFARERRFKKEE